MHDNSQATPQTHTETEYRLYIQFLGTEYIVDATYPNFTY